MEEKDYFYPRTKHTQLMNIYTQRETWYDCIKDETKARQLEPIFFVRILVGFTGPLRPLADV